MTHCEHADAVVARHLDGDVAATELLGAAWRPADWLDEHLRECAACRHELHRCRRLDAAVAEASGRATRDVTEEPERLDRLLAHAIAAATQPAPKLPPPVANTPAVRPRLPRTVAAAAVAAVAGALLAFGLGSVWRSATARAPAPTTPPPTPPTAPQPAAAALDFATLPTAARTPAPTLGIPLAAPTALLESVSGLGVPRSRADAQRLADLVGDRALADRLLLSARLQFTVLRATARQAPATASADQLRRQAAAWLLESPSRAGIDAWLPAIAGLDASPLLEAMLADARRRPTLSGQCAERVHAIGGNRNRGVGLGELATLTAAARLGGREIDQALRQLLRRADLQHELAAALRTPIARAGRTELLLDVLGDLVARGRGNDDDLARALFLGQPASVVGDLLGELASSRHTERRVRCLLALGALGDAAALPTLLSVLQRAPQTEASAAAFALSQLPPADLRELAPQAQRGPTAWLLRAALCRAGLAEADTYLRAAALTPAEAALLADDGSDLRQFTVLAALLRDRDPTSP